MANFEHDGLRFLCGGLRDALSQYGQPKIFNIHPGSQCTSDAFTALLRGLGIQISMDSKGRSVDNAFVERLWRSLE